MSDDDAPSAGGCERVQDERTKGSRDGEYLWKQSNIGEGLGEQCNKGEHLICTLHFDFLNANLVSKNAFGHRT
jgi:hypothetical protein